MDNSTSYKKIQVECPICHEVTNFAVFDTIEITDDSDFTESGKKSLWAHASGGSLFMFRCKCGFREPMTYKVSCLDSVHSLLLTVAESSNDEYAAKVTFDAMAESASSYICRTVNTTEDLSEKLRILSDGLDDRKIEILRRVMEAQITKELMDADDKLYYEDVDISCSYERLDDDRIVFEVKGWDDIDTSYAPFELYLNMQRFMPSDTSGQYKFDRKWADGLLEAEETDE